MERAILQMEIIIGFFGSIIIAFIGAFLLFQFQERQNRKRNRFWFQIENLWALGLYETAEIKSLRYKKW